MASEIRVNKLNSQTVVGTITLSPTGVDISGVTTVSTLRSNIGIFSGTITGEHHGDGSNLTGVASTENIRTNTNATFLQNINVSGTVTATSYAGDGSALTGIDVGLSTASAQVSGITTVIDLSKDDIRLDCTGLVTVDTKGGTEGGSHSLRIVNSGISTVTFNSYFKFPSGGAPNLPTASGAISLISFTVHTQGRVGVASVFLAGSSVNFS